MRIANFLCILRLLNYSNLCSAQNIKRSVIMRILNAIYYCQIHRVCLGTPPSRDTLTALILQFRQTYQNNLVLGKEPFKLYLAWSVSCWIVLR